MRLLVILSALFAACATSPEPQQGSTSEPPGSSPEDPGPRSGLPADQRLTDLSPSEREALCGWWAETLGGVGREQACVECNGDACTDWKTAVSPLADCVDWLEGVQCVATVSQAETCAFAEAPDLCAFPTACDPLDDC